MDTYVHPRIWGYGREDFVETKEVLMKRSHVLETRGPEALMADLQEAYHEAEEAANR
jgi:hypothetical protein